MSTSSGATERKYDVNGVDLLVVILVVMLVLVVVVMLLGYGVGDIRLSNSLVVSRLERVMAFLFRSCFLRIRDKYLSIY